MRVAQRKDQSPDVVQEVVDAWMRIEQAHGGGIAVSRHEDVPAVEVSVTECPERGGASLEEALHALDRCAPWWQLDLAAVAAQHDGTTATQSRIESGGLQEPALARVDIQPREVGASFGASAAVHAPEEGP